MQADYDSNSESSDPASNIKVISKVGKSNWLLAGAGTGNYWPVNETRNNSTKIITFKNRVF